MENKICPLCGSQMKLRSSVNGKFWGCSKYPECRATINANEDGSEKPFVKKEGKQEAIQKMHEEKQDGIAKSVAINKASDIVSALIRANLHSGDLSDIKKTIKDLSEYLYNLN